jgi:hypothetical protein
VKPIAPLLVAVLAPGALGTLLCVAGCQRAGRRIVQTVPDPSAKLVALVDEVEYANGLLTSMADRVLVVKAPSKDSDGTLVFSEDALPDLEKPSVEWVSGRLRITISRSAYVLHREAMADGIPVDVQPR